MKKLRLVEGFRSFIRDTQKTVVGVVYTLTTLIFWICRESIIALRGNSALIAVAGFALKWGFPIFALYGLYRLTLFWGTPKDVKVINSNLFNAGLVNHAKKPPTLVIKQPSKTNPKATEWVFFNNCIPVTEFEKKYPQLEIILDANPYKTELCKDTKQTRLYTVPRDSTPSVIRWKDEYLSQGSGFVLTLGEGDMGKEKVNIATSPHLLIGGATGSGKTLLVKSVIMQCVKRGARVFIGDFKGGIDFPPAWHTRCNIVTDETALLDALNDLAATVEERRALFVEAGCVNLDDYNEKTGNALERFVLACDEIAELTDKTGLSKEAKELVSKIEARLSLIARQGRAFGLHLVIATQRPDATVISGQIRNNLTYRVCGRADDVLSRIILDNTAAADHIPKDAQGLFINNNGTVFRGYLFDETTIFDE